MNIKVFDEVFVGISVFFQDHMRHWNDKDVPSHMIISGPSPGQSGHEKPFSKSSSGGYINGRNSANRRV
jgi:hypothetical protein